MAARRFIGALTVLISTAAACGGSSKPAPAAPSPTTTAAASAAIDLSFITPNGTPGAGVQAPVVGIVSQPAGACPDLTFVLSGVTIRVSSATTFESGACGDIREGVRAGAIGVKGADGSLDAKRVKIGAPPPAPVTGVVSSLTGSCPALTFVLETVTVRTSSTTVFEGGACADLTNGMRAGAIGPRMADGSISAEHVKMAAPQPSLVTGVVRSLGGACPALTFVLGNVTVRTSGRTVFEGGACGDLKDGMRAGAIGSRAADGGIDAERVKMAPPPTPAVTGAIASLSGTCPDVTFLIERTTIHVSAKTVFVGGTCADLKAGIKARATGPKRADGSLDAEKVEIPRQ